MMEPIRLVKYLCNSKRTMRPSPPMNGILLIRGWRNNNYNSETWIWWDDLISIQVSSNLMHITYLKPSIDKSYYTSSWSTQVCMLNRNIPYARAISWQENKFVANDFESHMCESGALTNKDVACVTPLWRGHIQEGDMCRKAHKRLISLYTAVRRHCTDWYEIWALTDHEIYYKNIAKGTTDPRVEFISPK